MKYLHKLIFLVSFVMVSGTVLAQDPPTVKIRELNTYSTPLVLNADVATHPLIGDEVYYEAVVVSYPRNSGLATPNAGAGGNEPGRIHLFVTDVNAIADGRDGMSMQLVVDGAQQTTLEGLDRGDVIGVTGTMASFGSNIQFNATNVVLLGSIGLDAKYANLAPLLEPRVIPLTDINKPSATADGLHTWVPENYTKYIHSYVKFEGLEIISRLVAENGRPWFFLSDGETVIFTRDVSLRYRNDRGTYAYDPDNATNPINRRYNYRRLEESLDGPFTAPAPGSIVDLSGFVYAPNNFDPVGFDESATTRTLRIAPWEDGIRWTADGTDPANKVTTEIPNDLVVQGFAPILDNVTVTPASGVTMTDAVMVSVDVLLPETNYTLNSVKISYSSYLSTTEDVGANTIIADMTQNGNTYSFTFPTFPSFTNIDFKIEAKATTPENVATRATTEGSFFVESATQTSPVIFSPDPSATYQNSVNVTLSTETDGATIYFTKDGSEPTTSSTEYTEAIPLTDTTTVKAVAIGTGLTLSPITERRYAIEKGAVTAPTLDIIRGGTVGDAYTYSGSAVVTYARDSRNQKYLMDSSGGLLIDDNDGTITSPYVIGDVMTGLSGTLGDFGEISQLIPSSDPGPSTSTAPVVPLEITLSELNLAMHESALVKVLGVSFVETGDFGSGTNYNITDASLTGGETVIFRTNFSEADYIGSAIPAGAITMTAIVGGFNGTPQLIARSTADLGAATPNENEGLPIKFELEQNYPNPFNPSTVIRYSLESSVRVKLEVFDIIGRKVATLVDGVQPVGQYNVNFDAAGLSSGTYIYRIDAGEFSSIKKMMLIK